MTEEIKNQRYSVQLGFFSSIWIATFCGLFEIAFGSENFMRIWYVEEYILLGIVFLAAFIVIQVTKQKSLKTVIIVMFLHMILSYISFFTFPNTLYENIIYLDILFYKFHNGVFQFELLIFTCTVIVGKLIQLIIFKQANDSDKITNQTTKFHQMIGYSFIIGTSIYIVFLHFLPRLTNRVFFLMILGSSITFLVFVYAPQQIQTFWNENLPKKKRFAKKRWLILNRFTIFVRYTMNLMTSTFAIFYYRTYLYTLPNIATLTELLSYFLIGIALSILILNIIQRKVPLIRINLEFLVPFLALLCLLSLFFVGSVIPRIIAAFLSGIIVVLTIIDYIHIITQTPVVTCGGIGLILLCIGFSMISNWISSDFFIENTIWYWVGIIGIGMCYFITNLILNYILNQKDLFVQ